MEYLGRPVDRGEEFFVQDYRVLVRKVRRQFVMEAQLTPEDGERDAGTAQEQTEVAADDVTTADSEPVKYDRPSNQY